jgi:hypothetical protein
LQLGPWPWEAAGSPESGGSGGASDRGTAWSCVQAHLGPGGSWSWGGEHAGVGIQRRQAAVAAVARSPARRAHGFDNARPWEVPRALGVLGAQVVKETAGEGGAPAAAAAMARRAVGDGGVDAVGRETRRPFISASSGVTTG